MYRPTPKSKKTKYIVIGVALALSGIGYLGYRSLLVKPEINQIEYGRRGKDQSKGASVQWGGNKEVLENAQVGSGTKPKDKGATLDLSGGAGQNDSGGGRRTRRNRE